MGTIFSLNNWPGHLSYVLIAISYWLTDMFWLLAVVGLSLETAQLSSVSSGDGDQLAEPLEALAEPLSPVMLRQIGNRSTISPPPAGTACSRSKLAARDALIGALRGGHGAKRPIERSARDELRPVDHARAGTDPKHAPEPDARHRAFERDIDTRVDEKPARVTKDEQEETRPGSVPAQAGANHVGEHNGPPTGERQQPER